MPRRIQRKRTKGWRMPAGGIYVGRPSRWGNPFRVTPFMGGWSVDYEGPDARTHLDMYENRAAALQRAVDDYRTLIEHGTAPFPRDLSQLAGHDLCCWCRPADPCHADVLLSLANGGAA